MNLVFNLKHVFTLEEVSEILADQLSLKSPVTQAHMLSYAQEKFLALSLEIKDPIPVRETHLWFDERNESFDIEETQELAPGLYDLSHFDDAIDESVSLRFLFMTFGLEKGGKLFQPVKSTYGEFGENRFYSVITNLKDLDDSRLKVTKENLQLFIDRIRVGDQKEAVQEKRKPGRPSLDEEMIEKIKAAHLQNPKKPARLIAEDLGIPESTVKKFWNS